MAGTAPPRPGEFVERDLDWTTRQQGLASDPVRSAWVSANAGSGKTHVLSQRVIRLLLSGCRPSAILCLTYTKAAASEMSNRVFERLAEWTVLNDSELGKRLRHLEGRRPDAERLAFARRLFARALETPGGLKIQTIHAFCEAVLHQFPLEANVAGHFEVMDEAAAARLLDEAREKLSSAVARGDDTDLTAAFNTVLEAGGERGLEDLFGELVRKRQPIRQFLAAAERAGGVEPVLRKALNIGPSETEDDLWPQAWPLPSLSQDDLDAYRAVALGQTAQTPKTKSQELLAAVRETDPCRRFEALLAVFLKQDGNPRNFRNAASAKVRQVFPEIGEKLDAAAMHMMALLDRLKTLRMIDATCAALELARRLDRDYETLKRRSGLLDFEDLVTRTAGLLQRDGAGPWVHYKLDRGIDHILVDEAQDTSPDQWAVIAKLAEEFFAGKSSREDIRTLFAVGDEKQSIYSFQGARPELFHETGRMVGKRAFAAERRFDALNLYLSFRSTGDVLLAVDTVFADEANRKGLSAADEGVAHAAHRARDPGAVDIWEMIGKEAADDHEDWKAPFDATPESSPPAVLARRVAGTIRDWLDSGRTRIDKGEPRKLTAGDILVLVRKRDGFVAALMRELKRRHIPVAGADRLRLVEHIAVEDLMALGRTMLLPGDDLSLCALLKSPLFDFSEDDIFRLAAQRAEGLSVFAHLAELARNGGRWASAHEYLTELMALADRMPVFDFYARILGRDGGRAKFLSRLGTEASDVLDEFLNVALEHETAALPGLQAFLANLEASSPEIKRELEQGRDEVRIMTVHASKGLEAPVVFLVDSGGKPAESTHVPKLRELAVDKTVGPLPPAVLWVPGKAVANTATEALKDAILNASEDEYRRLLYVGMTRAADHLVVCGYHGIRKPNDRHWHRMVAEALEGHAAGRTATYSAAGQEWQGLHFSTVQDERKPVAPEPEPEPDVVSAVPGRLLVPLTAAERLPRPLSPSAVGAVIDEDALSAPAGSPLFDRSQADGRPMERGRIVHRLLQLLPGIAPGTREAAAVRYLQRVIGGWPQQERDRICETVLAILQDARFAPCFAPASQAEVSLMGTLRVAGSDRAVSARLDRVAVTDDRVLIVDYKTNRPPVLRAEDVPNGHLVQMALYCALMRPLYPGRPVEAALLYTEAPALVPLPADRLASALADLEVESPN
ncbi:double-strand break repair helicase AddA [Hoeflea poritis]|uniref:DNA 3'-5' helicase n=1 Tax=Hoeflea poritis TaxID=2993659 RepID=A0ABT4VKR5_9HYPH|nr:double-strand break repair helicase AddA [Hoeflea poritis]MDA4845308.1 double-strand break repair helicase AddA [Hoeflea poritis]